MLDETMGQLCQLPLATDAKPHEKKDDLQDLKLSGTTSTKKSKLKH